MTIHLDTSFLIRALLAGTPQAATLDGWLAAGDAVGISAIAWCEFLCGPVNPAAIAAAQLVVGAPVPFAPEDAALAATLFNTTGRRRGSLPDCMIAAVAVRSGATVATVNPDDFRRFASAGVAFQS